MPSTKNRQILLRRRPRGHIDAEDFEYREAQVPEPDDGGILVRNLYLSLDPAMRGWMSAGDSYIEPVAVGDVMRGATVGEVAVSKHPDYAEGDKVLGMLGWQDYAVASGRGMPRKLPAVPLPLTHFLGVLGGTGLTAYFGLLDIGQPQRGDTVLVSAAAGAVGSVVGQIAKLHGCRVVGIAGSDAKCAWITDELGFDRAINYKSQDVAHAIPEACPDGIDVYFDNVGGEQLNTALAHINVGARVVICGAISVYNAVEPPPGPTNYIYLLLRRARMEGFVVLDYAKRFEEGTMQLAEWVTEGLIAHREHVVKGLEKAPEAIGMLFDGTNRGKLIVDVAGT